MQTNQDLTLRVEASRPKLTVSHQGQDLTFLHPSYGPNTYPQVALAIEQDNLQRPTMAQTASLVHAAFNSSDQYTATKSKI